MKESLLKWGENFKIPLNLRKTESGIIRDNYLEKRSEWEPYLRRDISSLVTYIIKYNNIMRETVGENDTKSYIFNFNV